MIYNKKFKGSATIIVIVMFAITLILAMATTFIAIGQNNKSKKIAEWNSTYYTLDARAVNAEFKMKEALTIAEQKTMEYMYNKEYERANSSIVPQYFQTKINDYYNTDNSFENKIDNILQRVYFFYANAYLEDLQNEVPNILLILKQEDVLIYEIQARCTFKSEDNTTLEVVQDINKINYDFVVNANKDITYTKARNTYFTTSSYFISQPLKE